MPPRSRRATFVSFLGKVDPNAAEFDMFDVTETFAESASSRSSSRIEGGPRRFADLTRPRFELTLTVVFEPASVDPQGLVRRLRGVRGAVL